MLVRLLLAFILVPLVELFVLIWIAEQTSLLATIALVIVTGVIGSVLARRQGLRAWHRFRQATAEGRLPTREIQDGVMIGVAALLLLTPGILSDAVGFALLVPAGREKIRRAVARRMADSLKAHVARGSARVHTNTQRAEMERASTSPRGSRANTIDAVNVRPVSQR